MRERRDRMSELKEFNTIIHENYHKNTFDEKCLNCWEDKTDNFMTNVMKNLDKKLKGEA